MRSAATFAILLATVAPAAHGASLKPERAESFLVAAGEQAELRWQVDSGPLAAPAEFVLRDYAEKSILAGRADINANGSLAIRLTLQQGFYDIEFPATGQRFGVVALPAFAGATDEFFCIDSALSWLVRDDATRQSLVRVLRRSGIRLSRERFSWAQISPQDGSWQWDGGSRYETLRTMYADSEVAVLEMCHDAPGWLGRVGKYPSDLARSAEDWQHICRRWRATWGALEVWNEPDIFFGDNLPADQYVALVRTVAHAAAAAAPDLTLVGGVVAHHHRAFLATAAKNGLLENIDAFSFHTYGRAPAMEALVDEYRAWLTAHDRPSQPLWLTECGRPWPKGTDRPAAAADQVSALDITMKAVEARCCGVARYFAFVYPFYEENDNNFGMMGRRATPLRSMAAYARLTALLAHKAYLGDLSCHDPAVIRSRVFGDARETIAVLYCGQPDRAAAVKLDLPVLRAEGIDGRQLQPAGDGRIPVPDGLVYVWLDRKQIEDRLRTETNAMRLWTVARQQPLRRKTASPIVMRFEADAKVFAAGSEGYRVIAQPAGQLSLSVRIFNLGDTSAEMTLQPSGERLPKDSAQPQTITVPAHRSMVATWSVGADKLFADDRRAEVCFAATDATGAETARLVIDVQGDATRSGTPSKP